MTDSLQQNHWDKFIQYTDVLIDLYKSLNQDHLHAVHNIIEMHKWSEHVFKSSQSIESWRFYILFTILWSVHVVLTFIEKAWTDKSSVIYYINNFSDWDSYNSIYNENFLDKDIKIILYYSCRR